MIYKRIDEYRKARNMTQSELAEKIGHRREWYGQSLAKRKLSLDDFLKIAKVLEVDPCELISGNKVSHTEMEVNLMRKELGMKDEMIEVLKMVVKSTTKEA